MCEMLVMAVDKFNPDPYLDAKQYKRGDVVCVQPDGWGWGKEELANPLFRIIKVPGVSVADALVFAESEVDIDPLNPSRMLQARVHKLDLDALPDPHGQVADHRRRNPLHKVNVSKSGLLAFKQRKAPIPDPNVFV